jgi:hypothetical protein
MKTALLLQLPDGRYLADDFTTWVENIAAAHRFIPGAALTASSPARRSIIAGKSFGVSVRRSCLCKLIRRCDRVRP